MNGNKIVITENENYVSVSPLEAISDDSLQYFDDVMDSVVNDFSTHVVLDLINVDYLFSNAVSSFIRVYKRLHKRQRSLVIINASGMVKNVLCSVNLDKVMTILNSFEELYQWQESVTIPSEKVQQLLLTSDKQNDVEVIRFTNEAYPDSPIHFTSDLGLFFSDVESELIVLDLSNAIDFETSAIASIVTYANQNKSRNGKMIIAGLTEANKELFEMLDIESSFQFAIDTQIAIKLLITA
ncbi:MAG: STAS domain-containing protein [Fibrobacteria bacterium]|nr:STAS domain-containing protein [Fibrobacteria bacterium]